MKVEHITDYFAEGYPVLHLEPQYLNGAFFHAMRDTESTIISISKEKFDEGKNELEYLMNTPVEIGAFEKNHHLLLLAKIGPIENSYVYPLPLDPIASVNQGTIDAWAESRFIVVCFIEGKEEPIFKGIRVQGIPDEIRKYVVNNWRSCFEHENGYSLKYLNFIQSALEIDPVELWKRGKNLGELEE